MKDGDGAGLLLEHLAVEEQQGGEGLLLGRSGDPGRAVFWGVGPSLAP